MENEEKKVAEFVNVHAKKCSLHKIKKAGAFIKTQLERQIIPVKENLKPQKQKKRRHSVQTAVRDCGGNAC